MNRNETTGIFLRNVIFGVEDSLAATVGLLAGIASEGTPIQTVILTGLIYIVVEAYSMGIGSYLSEESEEEYEHRKSEKRTSFFAAVAMFLACLFGGFVPLTPYFFFESGIAIVVSIIASLITLGILGYVQAKISKRSVLPRIFRMVFLGGTAILIGLVVGSLAGHIS